ncbi:NtaA/DmoA family FMN-dependent monooxygenase [Nocardia alba]|uniref:FMN-dependent oxidoreductase (Nitrilotriacetate monooxygenase family) n=1 Tax=Nocardia alba TaxID=225051 RepID=A0A4R1FQ29_9NOCA|nr:NtaA/DmoA family FMN-dependent monooxygenase [Nocardia alba]TCJ95634.1 FMN-dependent oxidoreductase (nitrilotriacetate monooxygenase family) [Nocardia alba]
MTYLRFNVNLLPGPLGTEVPGQHPFIDIEEFTEAAKLAEQGRLDAVFFADSQAIPPPGANGFGWALDPLTVLPAIARETERIGLIATASTTYAQPYQLARAILSIDHLSGGRAGWNIITTMEPTVARNFGLDSPPPRAERYRRATEFAEVVLALWRSWTDDVADRWDPANLQRTPIDHRGEFFAVAGPLQLPKSRQGIPVVYQAGGSDDGLALAAEFADAVFTVGVEESASARFRARLNSAARARRGRDVQVLPGLNLTVGSTEAEVARLLGEAEAEVENNGLAERFAERYGWEVTDLDLDGPVPDLAYGEDARSIGFARGGVELARDTRLSLRRFLVVGGGGHRRLFGTPESIAEDLIGWQRRGSADGFNLSVSSLRDFVDRVVPLLQERGVYRREYAGTTLRANITQHTG